MGFNWFVYTQACQVEFPSSRICTFREAVETVDLPEDLAGSGSTMIHRDEFAFSSPAPACITATGKFETGNFCSFPTPVACCALVP